MKSLFSRHVIYAKFGGRCAYCGVRLAAVKWHRDHKEPLLRYRNVRYSFSGQTGCKYPARHTASNVVPACARCNKDKANNDLETWRASLVPRPYVFWFEKER